MTFKLKEWIAKVTQTLAEQRDSESPIIIYKSYSFTRSDSFPAGATLAITGNDIGFSIPDGYTILGIRTAYAGNGQAEIQQFRLGQGEGQFVRIRNGGTSAISNFTIYVTVNFIRSDYYKQVSDE